MDEKRIREIIREELALTRIAIIPSNEYSGLTYQEVRNKLDEADPHIKESLHYMLDHMKIT